VILASGYDEARAMAGAPGASPPVFLKKPFSLEELEEAVARAIAVATAAW
jgi:FixJ family two-component response regulator